MKWLKNFSIKTLFSNKKFAVSFSVVVAFIFWLIIVIDQNPEREITFNSVPVSISATGTNLEKLDMDIVSKNVGETVSVTVKGPSYVVSSLKSDDILVTADLSNIETTGSYTVTLIARKISGKTDYDIISINPSTVSIVVDKRRDEYKEVIVSAPNVTVDLSADPDLICEKPEVLEEKIHIKGPESEFIRIAEVRAVVEDEIALTSTKTFVGRIKLYDANGNELDPSPFTISAETVNVTVVVNKRATFNLIPSFVNKPSNAPDLKYTITLESGEAITKIDVKGAPDVINALTAVELEPIDFSEISLKNKKFEVGLALSSENIQPIDNIDTVTLEFDLSGYREKTISSIDIQVINAPSGLTVDRATVRNVTFCVPKSIAGTFKASNVTATVDLAGKVAGDSVVVAFTSNNNGVWAVGTSNVTVKSE